MQAMQSPLELALHSACALAAAVQQRALAPAALAALHPAVGAGFKQPSGEPDAAFVKLYESLFETETAA
jgi:hypothetical protein